VRAPDRLREYRSCTARRSDGAQALRAKQVFTMASAAFAAGCFWGVEERFTALPGVLSTEVGYAGGTTVEPSYKDVCSNETGHAETVRIEYDPSATSYEQLLAAFFAMHDPTTPDRQGPDRGSQYRSVIFTDGPEQERAARAYVEALTASRRFRQPIVTQIVPAREFWRAEDYHQKYFLKQRAPHRRAM
jgi:peptide-methionine (S)-S-oxide reductase